MFRISTKEYSKLGLLILHRIDPEQHRSQREEENNSTLCSEERLVPCRRTIWSSPRLSPTTSFLNFNNIAWRYQPIKWLSFFYWFLNRWSFGLSEDPDNAGNLARIEKAWRFRRRWKLFIEWSFCRFPI